MPPPYPYSLPGQSEPAPILIMATTWLQRIVAGLVNAGEVDFSRLAINNEGDGCLSGYGTRIDVLQRVDVLSEFGMRNVGMPAEGRYVSIRRE